MEFSGGIRYLLAHEKREEACTLNGVKIEVGKKTFRYKGKEISHLTGRRVLVWFDPEHLESVVVTDLDRNNPICVARANEVDALQCLTNPKSETLAVELARIEDQASYMKAKFNVVKSKFPMPQRKTFEDIRALRLGQEIAQQKENMKTEQAQDSAFENLLAISTWPRRRLPGRRRRRRWHACTN